MNKREQSYDKFFVMRCLVINHSFLLSGWNQQHRYDNDELLFIRVFEKYKEIRDEPAPLSLVQKYEKQFKIKKERLDNIRLEIDEITSATNNYTIGLEWLEF